MPQVPYDILDRIRDLEQQVRELTGRSQIRPAMDQILAGTVVVGAGGRLFVKTPGGVTMLYVGDILPTHPDGSRQTGLVLRREDNSAALSVWDPAGGPQTVMLWDRNSHAILSEDSVTGEGLSRPFIGGGAWFGITEQPQFTTTSTSFTTLMISPWVKQQPRVAATYLVRCSDATTSGEIQLTDDAGTAISPVISVSAGSYTYAFTDGPMTGAHEEYTWLRWQARVLPGSTGNIGVKGLGLFGMGL